MKASQLCLLACLAAALLGGATAQLDDLLGAVSGSVGSGVGKAISDRECEVAWEGSVVGGSLSYYYSILEDARVRKAWAKHRHVCLCFPGNNDS